MGKEIKYVATATYKYGDPGREFLVKTDKGEKDAISKAHEDIVNWEKKTGQRMFLFNIKSVTGDGE